MLRPFRWVIAFPLLPSGSLDVLDVNDISETQHLESRQSVERDEFQLRPTGETVVLTVGDGVFTAFLTITLMTRLDSTPPSRSRTLA
jgi:hypothetical protein